MKIELGHSFKWVTNGTVGTATFIIANKYEIHVLSLS